MIKRFMGICPKQNKVTTVPIEYIDTSDAIVTNYTKGRLKCYYSDKYHCSESSCPIWQSAQRDISR